MSDLASRLRELREAKNWTVADMAERSGIPKRTLDKYMLRSGASLPGFDALCALSKGLGVSMDWLVFGEDIAGEGVELFAERSAHFVVKLFSETLIKYHLEGRASIIESDTILALAPEEWAADLGGRAGEYARDLVAKGVTKEDLLTWRHQTTERITELLRERVASLTTTATGN